MRAQRVYQQVRLGRVVRVHGALADARSGGDVGDASAVVPPCREDLGGGAEQPVTRVGCGDASDAAHAQN